MSYCVVAVAVSPYIGTCKIRLAFLLATPYILRSIQACQQHPTAKSNAQCARARPLCPHFAAPDLLNGNGAVHASALMRLAVERVLARLGELGGHLLPGRVQVVLVADGVNADAGLPARGGARHHRTSKTSAQPTVSDSDQAQQPPACPECALDIVRISALATQPSLTLMTGYKYALSTSLL